MQIENILNQAQSTAAIKNIASAFGIDPEKTEIAVEYMLQTLADRIERNTLSRGGVADMVDLLGRPQAGRAFNDPENLGSSQMVEIGNYILDVLYGDKHLSRGIAARAASRANINEEVTKRMWPVVASLMIGALQSKAQPSLERTFSGFAARSPLPLPGERPIGGSDNSTGEWEAELPRPAGSSGGGMGGTTGGKSPLPLPGDDIPGIDPRQSPNRFPDLPDIIRRGGRRVELPDSGENIGTGSLENVIRQILANLLGFKNGGIMSWIVSMLLSKWGLSLLMRIVRRVLTGR